MFATPNGIPKLQNISVGLRSFHDDGRSSGRVLKYTSLRCRVSEGGRSLIGIEVSACT